MPDVPRSHLLAYAVAALLIVGVGVRQLGRTKTEEPAVAAAAPIAVQRQQATGGEVVVHVAGAVRHAGVYHLRAGARVDDAVRRAGGARPRADLSQLNLAAKLEDGRQVLVPVRTPAAGAGSGGGPAVGTAATTGPLNLNTATLEQLDALSGIGPATARKILDYREEHSGFSTVEELGEVPGIGDVRLAALREEVRV